MIIFYKLYKRISKSNYVNAYINFYFPIVEKKLFVAEWSGASVQWLYDEGSSLRVVKVYFRISLQYLYILTILLKVKK